MNRFRNIEEQMSAYLDGQMSDEEMQAFETVVAATPALLDRMERWAETDALVAHTVPKPSAEHLAGLVKPAPIGRSAVGLGKVAAMAAVFVIGGLVGYGLNAVQGQGGDHPAVVVQAMAGATAAHRMFTAEVRHAVEVPATETEHLQTWLSKRMGRDMQVPQLETHGLTFVGGRMLPFGDRAAAQYMYENAAGERMTLFMTRADRDTHTSLRYVRDDGLTTARWQEGAWLFILVAPLDRDTFSPIATDVHESLI